MKRGLKRKAEKKVTGWVECGMKAIHDKSEGT
jgi:hypothetical protein